MVTRFIRTAGIASLSIAAALATVSVAAPAQAAGARTVKVSTAGLDLNSTAGAAALEARLATAARRVCATNNRLTLEDVAETARCREVAMTAIKPQVDLAMAAARRDQAYADGSTALTAIGR